MHIQLLRQILEEEFIHTWCSPIPEDSAILRKKSEWASDYRSLPKVSPPLGGKGRDRTENTATNALGWSSYDKRNNRKRGFNIMRVMNALESTMCSNKYFQNPYHYLVWHSYSYCLPACYSLHLLTLSPFLPQHSLSPVLLISPTFDLQKTNFLSAKSFTNLRLFFLQSKYNILKNKTKN